jgi:chemotaxis protein CheD
MTAATDIVVRMGELAVSADPGACLVTIGLGSCIGVVLVDRIRRVTGLAHVMLPQARAAQADGLPAAARGKYADLAVPALVDAMLAAGARRLGLQVALVGGARMFGAGAGSLDVGARNEAAVRDALAAARLRVRGAATGGDKGRTVRAEVGSGQVLVRMAQRADEVIMQGAA